MSPRIAYTSSRRGPWRDLYLKSALPYGVWLCADDREVLFNRDYTPIYQRSRGGPCSIADHREWVPFVDQRWFYTDRDPPHRRRATVELLQEVMLRFRAGEHLAELIFPTTHAA